MSIKTTAILTLLCLCCASIYAQEPRQSISAHWGITIPSGSGFIGKAGGVNPSLEWSYSLLPALSAGLSVGYGYATERGEGDEYLNEDFASGYREKTLSTMPLLAQLRYFPFAERNSLFSPYIGAGAGIQYATFHITGDAIQSNGTSNWAEVFSAEAGTRIQPKASGTLYVDVRCLWQYGGNGWTSVQVKSIRRWGLAVGVGAKF